MRSRKTFFQGLACCLSMVACHQGASQRNHPAPPETSYRVESLVLTAEGISSPVRVASVTPLFFQAVRERPSLGRSFVAEEHRPKNRGGVVILSHGLWQQRFGSDAAVIGKGVALDGRARTVVGVMPKGFDVPAGAEAWLPGAEPDR